LSFRLKEKRRKHMKIREVTEEEFRQAIADEEEKAYNTMADILPPDTPVDDSWLFTDTESSNRTYPCVYSRYSNTVWCPASQAEKPTRSLPKTFHCFVKPEVHSLRHATDTVCSGLSMRHTARCYAVVDGKYYIGEHQVGKCPWKTARKETT